MFLRASPRSSTELIRQLFTDPEFVEETTAIWRKLVVDEVTRSVSGVLGEMEFPVSEDLKTYFAMALKGWWGSVVNNARREATQEEGDLKETFEYAQMNQGNPMAQQMLFNKVAEKSPWMAMLMQMMQGQGSHQISPGRGGPGGF